MQDDKLGACVSDARQIAFVYFVTSMTRLDSRPRSYVLIVISLRRYYHPFSCTRSHSSVRAVHGRSGPLRVVKPAVAARPRTD
jgi:hypothetical protein